MKSRILVAGLTLLRWTWRFHVSGVPPTQGVLAFWHGEMLPVWAFFAGRGAVALVSQSQDGQLLASLLESWGYRCVRGSSSRGGKEALSQLIEMAKSGALVMITPDGPRGPRGVVKPGAVRCAQQAAVSLTWCRVRCRWAWRFEKSWDRFLLPLPWAKVELEFSEVAPYPAMLSDEDVSSYCQFLARRYASRK